MPKISINQLALYLGATPRKRQSIIKNQLEPKPFLVNYYKDACSSIVRFIRHNMADEEIIVRAIETLHVKAAACIDEQKRHERTRHEANREALDSFLQNYSKLELPDNPAFPTLPRTHPKVERNGIEISVRPEIRVTGSYRGRDIEGGIKLYFAKNDPLTEVTGNYVSTVVHKYFEENQVSEGPGTNKRFCQVMDVFSGEVYCAPTSTITRFRDIDVACREIAMWWTHLEEKEKEAAAKAMRGS